MPTTTTTVKPTMVNVNVRVSKDIKDKSEEILTRMGFSMSTAINSFLRQVVLERGLPYRPSTMRVIPGVPDEDILTREELDNLLVEALREADEGKCHPAEEVLKEISEEYGFAI